MTMPQRSCLAIVLAAGEGARMRSATPKVLHAIAGRSMLAHALDAVAKAGATTLAVVIGPGRDDVAAQAERIAPGVTIVTQAERRGTAHAVLAARAAIAQGVDDVVVVFGDTPLIEPATIAALRRTLAQGAAVAVLGFEADDATGYGRLLVEGGVLTAIREHKDANEAERAVTLCNAGVMALDGAHALALLDAVGCDNAQGEFYLPDVIAIAGTRGLVARVVVAMEAEVRGVNDRVQLAACEALMQARLREAVMRGGATLVAPETVFLSFDTVLGRDVVVEPHVVFGPGVTVEEGVVIHAFSHLQGARIASGCSVGPFARLRPGAELGAGARVGNFVEVKASSLGPGAKVNHLAYIGDASIGGAANIGAGTITCNYDGVAKHRTIVGPGAFVGSNSALVAPVTIGAGAFVGSGSVVTSDVAPDALALARGRQVDKPGWAAAFRAKAGK